MRPRLLETMKDGCSKICRQSPSPLALAGTYHTALDLFRHLHFGQLTDRNEEEDESMINSGSS